MAAAKRITVIIACRDRGRFLHPCVLSVIQALQHADSNLGARTELICATDSPSAQTVEYLQTQLPSFAKVVTTDGEGLSTSKNKSIAASNGDFVSLLDSDTMVSGNWLTAAAQTAAADTRPIVLHPATVVGFGVQTNLSIIPDQDNPDFADETLIWRNPWPDVSFASRELFSANPFITAETQRGFGQEYWHWICQTVAEGALHRTVPSTLACYHQYDDQRLGAEEDLRRTLMPPCRLFQQTAQAGRS
jgi:glycosyltransferase involved in cell wall biosynthesis